MRLITRSIAFAALTLASACQVNVDENLQAAAENQAEAFGNSLEAAASEAGNAVDEAGDVVANQAGELRNGIDVDVNLGRSDNETATNEQ